MMLVGLVLGGGLVGVFWWRRSRKRTAIEVIITLEHHCNQTHSAYNRGALQVLPVIATGTCTSSSPPR